MLEAPPARGQEQTQRWLESNGAVEDIEQLTNVRDDAARRIRPRKFGRRRHTTTITERPSIGAVHGHPIPKSIADMSFRWINITMYDIYHPLGDHDSYFVWFADQGCPYPQAPAAPVANRPVPSEWLNVPKTESGVRDPTIYWIGKEREICKGRGLPLPPYPPPFTHLNEPGEDRPPRFVSIDENLFNKGFDEVDQAVDTYINSHSITALNDHVNGVEPSFSDAESDAEALYPTARMTSIRDQYWESFEVTPAADDADDRASSMSSWSSWREPSNGMSDCNPVRISKLSGDQARMSEQDESEGDSSGGSCNHNDHLREVQDGESAGDYDIWSDEIRFIYQSLSGFSPEDQSPKNEPDEIAESSRSLSLRTAGYLNDDGKSPDGPSDSDDEMVKPPFEPSTPQGVQALNVIRRALDLEDDVSLFEIQKLLVNTDILREIALRRVPNSSLYDNDLDSTFERNCTNCSIAANTFDAIAVIAWPDRKLRSTLQMLAKRDMTSEERKEWLEFIRVPVDSTGQRFGTRLAIEDEDEQTILSRVRTQPTHRPTRPSMLRHSVSAEVIRSAGSPFGQVAEAVALPRAARMPSRRQPRRL